MFDCHFTGAFQLKNRWRTCICKHSVKRIKFLSSEPSSAQRMSAWLPFQVLVTPSKKSCPLERTGLDGSACLQRCKQALLRNFSPTGSTCGHKIYLFSSSSGSPQISLSHRLPTCGLSVLFLLLFCSGRKIKILSWKVSQESVTACKDRQSSSDFYKSMGLFTQVHEVSVLMFHIFFSFSLLRAVGRQPGHHCLRKSIHNHFPRAMSVFTAVL